MKKEETGQSHEELNLLRRRVAELEQAESQSRQIEEKLRLERDFNATLIQAAPLFFVAIAADGRTLMMNKAMLQSLGYTATEVVDRDYLTTFVPEKDREALSRVFATLTTSHEPTLNKNRVLTKAGRKLLVEWHGRQVFKEDGALDFFFGAGVDITERVQTEALYQAIGNPTLILDPEHNIISANRAATKVTGQPEEKLVGKKCYEVLHNTDEPPKGCPLVKMLASSRMETAEMEIEALGRTYLVSCTPVLDERGQLEKIIHVATDITEDKHAERRMEYLNLVLRAIRSVNQLVVREKDRDRLIQQACDLLIETRGYYNVWIALFDESGMLITSVNAGLRKEFTPLIEKLKHGELTACGQRALAQSGVVATEDPPSSCNDCPLAMSYAGRGALTTRLEHGGKVYGMISASVPREGTTGEEEQSLFNEVAGDIAFALYTIDVEEGRKNATEELQATRKRLELAMDAGDHGFWDWNLDTNDIYFSSRYYTMLGYEPGELPMRLETWIFLLHPEDRERVVPLVQKYVENAQPYEVKFRLRTKDGEWRWISGRGKSFEKDAQGNPHRALGVHVDITERVQAEQALRQEKDRAQTYLDVAAVAMVALDREGRITLVNRYGAAMLGYSEGELLGKDWFATCMPDRLRSDVRGVFEQLMSGEAEQPEHFENTVLTKGGKERIIDWHSVLLRDESGGITGTLSSGLDITERKKAEEKQRKTSRALKALSESNQMMVRVTEEAELLYETCRIIVEVGQYRLAWIGFAQQDEQKTVRPVAQAGFEEGYLDTVDITWADTERGRGPTGTAIRTDKISIVQDILTDPEFAPWREAAVKQGYASSLALPLHVNDHVLGALNIFASEPNAFDADELRLLMELSKDLSYGISALRSRAEHTKTEKTLQEHEKRYRRIYQFSPDAIILHDLDMNILDANDKAVKKFGYSKAELLKKTIFELHPETELKHSAQVLDAMKDTGMVTVETAFVRKDESVFLAEATPCKYTLGSKTIIHVVIRDVTERVRAEEEKLAMEAQLRQGQKLESIGTLASGVAHEINNPLTGMINYADLIESRIEDAQLKQFAQGIIKEGNRVAEIVKNLLYFARQEKQSHSPARMEDIIDSSLTLIGAVLRKDQITIEKKIAQDLPKVRCRSQQIEQVIINLLTNARDALNERYSGYHEDKLIKIQAQPFEKDGVECIRTTIEDHGNGISEEIIARVFDPFFTTKPRDVGTGIGLSVSYGIVRDHHGEISVESKLGEYTRFHIDLRVNNGWKLG